MNRKKFKTPLMMAKFNRPRLPEKFEKSANMTLQFFFTNTTWVSKSAEFDVDFASVKKVADRKTFLGHFLHFC
jgi:hypothetical protein